MVVAASLSMKNVAELARRRAQVYRVLSLAYAMPVDRSVLGVFRGWSQKESLLSAVELPRTMKRGLDNLRAWFNSEGDKDLNVLLAGLAVEFQRLFRGLDRGQSPPPPYESVYVDSGYVFGNSTKAVGRKYHEFRLATEGREPPDHLALELDFMRFLCEKEAEGWLGTDSALMWVEDEYGFLTGHLGRWVLAFCNNVRAWKSSKFYRGLADLTEGWICSDQKVVMGLRYDLGMRA